MISISGILHLESGTTTLPWKETTVAHTEFTLVLLFINTAASFVLGYYAHKTNWFN